MAEAAVLLTVRSHRASLRCYLTAHTLAQPGWSPVIGVVVVLVIAVGWRDGARAMVLVGWCSEWGVIGHGVWVVRNVVVAHVGVAYAVAVWDSSTPAHGNTGLRAGGQQLRPLVEVRQRGRSVPTASSSCR